MNDHDETLEQAWRREHVKRVELETRVQQLQWRVSELEEMLIEHERSKAEP